jgi:hypothetical protein
MDKDDMVVINANLAISGSTLQKLVSAAKAFKGPDGRGYYRIDTADLLSDMISQFLIDREFDAYIEDRRHYETLLADRGRNEIG